MMKFFSLLFKAAFTNTPSKKFKLYCDLMFWGQKNSRLIRKHYQRRIFYIFNCEISNQAAICSTTFYPHPCGIIIGSAVVVESGCSIYQHVTLGSNFNKPGMPFIEKDCTIGAGARIIGDIRIGKNSIIGANAVVTKSVPANSVVIGHNQILQSKKS
jgi:serine O-acetyltransferase